MKKTIIGLVAMAVVALFAGLGWAADAEVADSLQHSEAGIVVASNDAQQEMAADEAVYEEEVADEEMAEGEAVDEEVTEEEQVEEEAPAEGDAGR